MQEKEIGKLCAIFYESFSILYERNRDFHSTNRILMQGVSRKAEPFIHLTNYVKDFEKRMLDRMERDFYNKDQFFSNLPYDQANPKKRKIGLSNELDSSLSSKRMKNIPCETLKMGEIEIYIDDEYRDSIIVSTQLVNEYENLSKKHNFKRESFLQQKKKELQDQKPSSWISRENLFLKNVEKFLMNVTNGSSNGKSEKTSEFIASSQKGQEEDCLNEVTSPCISNDYSSNKNQSKDVSINKRENTNDIDQFLNLSSKNKRSSKKSFNSPNRKKIINKKEKLSSRENRRFSNKNDSKTDQEENFNILLNMVEKNIKNFLQLSNEFSFGKKSDKSDEIKKNETQIISKLNFDDVGSASSLKKAKISPISSCENLQNISDEIDEINIFFSGKQTIEKSV